MRESAPQAHLLLIAPVRIPSLRLFRRNVGAMKMDTRWIRFGIKGQCDLYGILRGGRTIELECKAPYRELTDEQCAWRDWCVQWGVPWLLLRQGRHEDPRETAERWCDEIAAALCTAELKP